LHNRKLQEQTMNAITRMNPPTLPDAGAAGYSQISIFDGGRIAFISGQVAWNRDGSPTPATLPEQAELVVRNARNALAAIGATAKDLLMVRVYLVNLNDERMGQLMPHISVLFDGEQPSLTGIGVAALAAPDLQLEIEMTVRVPD
jgi:enamine deaminase RidA (YjgF/YER057c/UK114 family)